MGQAVNLDELRDRLREFPMTAAEHEAVEELFGRCGRIVRMETARLEERVRHLEVELQGPQARLLKVIDEGLQELGLSVWCLVSIKSGNADPRANELLESIAGWMAEKGVPVEHVRAVAERMEAASVKKGREGSL